MVTQSSKGYTLRQPISFYFLLAVNFHCGMLIVFCAHSGIIALFQRTLVATLGKSRNLILAHSRPSRYRGTTKTLNASRYFTFYALILVTVVNYFCVL